MGMMVSHPMPRVLAAQLRDLIDEVSALIYAMTQPVVQRLEATLACTDAARIADWPTPQVRHHLDEEFTASNRRTRQPQVAFYWHVERTDS